MLLNSCFKYFCKLSTYFFSKLNKTINIQIKKYIIIIINIIIYNPWLVCLIWCTGSKAWTFDNKEFTLKYTFSWFLSTFGMGKLGKICQLPWKEHHFLQYNLVFLIHINFDYFLSGLLATTCVFLYHCALAYYTKSLTLPFLQQLL